MRALAAEIVGDDRDATRVAHKLLDWVFENLKEATVSVPNAVQVLEMRKGDCNEHAVLCAGASRGTATRMVAGTVWADVRRRVRRLDDHVEPDLARDWVAVDPTFGHLGGRHSRRARRGRSQRTSRSSASSGGCFGSERVTERR